MRPTVEWTRDPLKPEYLPPNVGAAELDHRTCCSSPKQDRAFTVRSLVAASLGAVVVTLLLRSAAAVWASGLFLTISILVGVALALFKFLHRVPWTNWAKWLAFGPAVWLLSVASTSAFSVLLLPIALAIAVWLADGVITHHAYWMHAHPQLDRPTRQRWLACWPRTPWWHEFRVLLKPLQQRRDASEHPQAVRERIERNHYALGFGVVAGSYLVAALFVLILPAPWLNAAIGLAILSALLLGYGFYSARHLTRQVGWRWTLRVTFDALVSWFTYNRHETRAAGVFQSPAGPALRRAASGTVSLFAIALATLPLAAYFPIGAFTFGLPPWVRVAQEPWPWERIGLSSSAESRDRGSQVEYELPDAYARAIPSEQREQLALAVASLDRRQREADRAYARMTASPEAALWTTLRGALAGSPLFIAALVATVLTCIAFSPVLLFSTLFAVGARRLVHHRITLQGIGERVGDYQRREPLTHYEAYVDRLQSSEFKTHDELGQEVWERDHLLVGSSLYGDYPVLVPQDIFAEHAHITGDTGSGKSSLGIAPLVAQILGRMGNGGPPCSVVVLDLKGDRTLFETARVAAAEANRSRARRNRIKTRWFTNQPGCATHVFNPFLQELMGTVTPQQKASILLQSLGLDYGEAYGAAYFSSVHRDILVKLLEYDRTIDSFQKLQQVYREEMPNIRREFNLSAKQIQDASHLFTVIDSLASFEALNVTPANEHPQAVIDCQIDMSRVLEHPHVVYFHLIAALEEKSVAEIAKLALHSLLAAAVRRGHRKHQVYVFIDEFQQVVSANLEIVLRQARSHKIAVILANQTLHDLQRNDVNLIPTVTANTRYKQVFSASDLLQQDALITASGETIYSMFSKSYSYTGRATSSSTTETTTIREELGPRLRRNDVIGVSDRPLQSLVHVTRGKGFAQFGGFIFPMQSAFHISPEEYQRRAAAEWPSPGDGTIVPTIKQPDRESEQDQPKPRPTRKPPPPDTLSDLQDRVDQL